MPRETVRMSVVLDLTKQLMRCGLGRSQAEEILRVIHEVHWELTELEKGTQPMTTKQVPFTETFGAMTPVPPGHAKWELVALRDRFGNVWDILPNSRVGLRSAVNVQMKRAAAEVDYGPLSGCEVDQLEGLIRDHQLLWENYRRVQDQLEDLHQERAVQKAEQNEESRALESGPAVEEEPS